MRNIIAIFLFLAICAPAARADIIHLKNGNDVEGIITDRREGSVTVKLDIGTMIFAPDEIESVEIASDEEKGALEARWEDERLKNAGAPMRVKPVIEEAEKPSEKRGPAASPRGGPVPSAISWIYNFDSGMAMARKDNKTVMIDFYTDWCGWCKKLDNETYKDKKVLAASTRFVCIKIDADANKALAGKYNVRGYPTILFLDASGKEIDRIGGYLPPEPFAARLEKIAR